MVTNLNISNHSGTTQHSKVIICNIFIRIRTNGEIPIYLFKTEIWHEKIEIYALKHRTSFDESNRRDSRKDSIKSMIFVMQKCVDKQEINKKIIISKLFEMDAQYKA